jgi:Branched-chain amino acid transport system / permease component
VGSRSTPPDSPFAADEIDEAAQLMGIPVPRIFLITFAAGSALVGLAACMMMPLLSVFPTVGLNFVLIDPPISLGELRSLGIMGNNPPQSIFELGRHQIDALLPRLNLGFQV